MNDGYTVYDEDFKDDDAEGYNVIFPAMPEIVTWGRTMEEAKANATEALTCHIKGMKRDGDKLPQDISVENPLVVDKILLYDSALADAQGAGGACSAQKSRLGRSRNRRLSSPT